MQVNNLDNFYVPLEERQPQQENCFTKFFLDLWILLYKNYKITIRNIKSSCCLLISPFFICLIIYLFQIISNDVTDIHIVNPDVQQNDCILPKCIGDDCVTVGYGILGTRHEDWVNYTLNYVANRNGLNATTDVKLLYMGLNYTKVNDYLLKHMNKTMIVVVFCTLDSITIFGVDVGCQDLAFLGYPNDKPYLYTILFNQTFLPSTLFQDQSIAMPKDPLALALKVSIDNALISYTELKTNNKKVNISNPVVDDKISMEFEDFPKVPNRMMQNFDIIGNGGAFWFIIPSMFNFLIIQNEIVREKEYKLRQYLSVVGVTHFAFWISWFLTSVIYSCLVSAMTMAFGLLFQYRFFLDTPFFVLFLLFFLFSLAMQFVTYFVSTLVPNMKMSNTISYSLILLAWVLEMLLSSSALLYHLYDPAIPSWARWFVVIITFYPPFNFSKIFVDIAQKSGYHFNMAESRWDLGPGYNWDDLTKDIEGNFGALGGDFTAPPTINSFYFLLMNCGFYAVLSWYFDHVVQSNRGVSYRPWFFLDPRFWCRRRVLFKKKKKSRISFINSMIEQSVGEEVNTIEIEKNRVLENIKEGLETNGIRIANVSKTYKRYPCGCESKQDVKAVRNLFLEVEEGELLSLLGHNGAGKTTLISIMTGILSPSNGSIFISNFEISQDMDLIRKVIGVCPQFDILWSELTAIEHLKIYGRIKRIPKEKLMSQCLEKLQDVNLAHVENAQVRTFSGGMKRRLSMAISSLGNPKVLFLDEPTTGMDPKSRRQVWSLIQEMKKNRVVILTTHAMEEADVLSDRIAVMVEGRLKCIGTPLFLKNNFGDGYRLNLVTQPENTEEVVGILKKIMPSGKLSNSSAGSIVYSILPMFNNQLGKFFKIMEAKTDYDDKLSKLGDRFRFLVKDWGLSHTTMEEVFMKVTKENKEKKE